MTAGRRHAASAVDELVVTNFRSRSFHEIYNKTRAIFSTTPYKCHCTTFWNRTRNVRNVKIVVIIYRQNSRPRWRLSQMMMSLWSPADGRCWYTQYNRQQQLTSRAETNASRKRTKLVVTHRRPAAAAMTGCKPVRLGYSTADCRDDPLDQGTRTVRQSVARSHAIVGERS